MLVLCAAVAGHAADSDKEKDFGFGSPAPVEAPANFSNAARDSTFRARLRLTASIGAGYIYAPSESVESDETLQSMSDDSRKGRDIQVSAAYMLNSRIGVGLMYSNFSSSASGSESVIDYSTYTTETFNLNADCSVNFIGAVLATRSSASGAAFQTAIGLGQASYTMNITESAAGVNESATATGTGLGLFFLVGAEFYINPHVAIALDVNGLRCTINNVTIGSTNIGDNDVSRIGASAGLHFYL
jgi:outer membrane protein W